MIELSIRHEPDLVLLKEYDGDFDQVESLEFMVEIEELPIEITKFKNLKRLSISFTRAKNISSCITEFKKLEELYVFDQIDTIPSGIIQLQALRTIRISGRYTEIPSELGELVNLELLHLYGEEFKYLPATISKLNNLKELVINGNNLEEVPEEVGRLDSLERLSIGSHRLRELPASLRKLVNLKGIDFDCDPMAAIDLQLAAIPDYFREFKLLEFFRVNNIKFDDIERFLDCWRRMQVLSLTECGLSEIPQSIRQMRSLKRLVLAGNEIKEIPTWISELECLEHLDMSSNGISEIPIKEIMRLHNLTSLVMYENPISVNRAQDYTSQLSDKINNRIFD